MDASGTDDEVSWALTKSDATFTAGSSATQTNSGVNGQTFADAGQLVAGTYTLVFTADLSESINNQGNRQAGWTLTNFTLTPLAIPEPSPLMACWLATLAIDRRRR